MKASICRSCAICLAGFSTAQQAEWCKKLPRPGYSKLERVANADPWFEVYKIRPGVFAIYEPHQAEEVISYLIVGGDRALLFDTGMGISNIQAVVAGLTKLPVSVVNSHTHNDHVGDNWRFNDIYGMDTDFTRRQRSRIESGRAGRVGSPGTLRGFAHRVRCQGVRHQALPHYALAA